MTKRYTDGLMRVGMRVGGCCLQRSPQALSLASLSKLTLYKVGSGQPQSSTQSNAKLRQRVRPRMPVCICGITVPASSASTPVVFVFRILRRDGMHCASGLVHGQRAWVVIGLRSELALGRSGTVCR